MLSKGQSWKVLDRGYLKFINSMGDDEEVVEAARMSTGRGFVSWEPYRRCDSCDTVEMSKGKDAPTQCKADQTGSHKWRAFPRGDIGFMEYMYSHRHMTPFEMPELIVEFKAPIVVVWEWVRHRTQSFNIESGRYAQLADEHYLPSLERMAKQSATNKQDSSLDVFSKEDAQLIIDRMAAEQRYVYDNYDNNIKAGLVKEVSRLNAPMSRYTRGRAKANLRNWFAFLLLRKQTKHSKPQWEIARYADVVGEIIQTLWPRAYALFEEHTLYAETFSRSEMRALRSLLYNMNIEEAAITGEPRYVKSMLAKVRETA